MALINTSTGAPCPENRAGFFGGRARIVVYNVYQGILERNSVDKIRENRTVAPCPEFRELIEVLARVRASLFPMS